ncbi:MAG: 16S rRNA (guanine(966)-N(2))-methyltransferase RsmD [Gammaproteobacteria bacterium]|jgi:16S rRNA (guanine966-N2)-methyltransferase|nr:16S rRNA (guanine(966)-N(2))-methyltransferase RsmD [Gammaproteobacteria bacterium]
MAKQSTPGKVRIIGGKWRGRRLSLADAEIRPTSDRVRETLFNWLGYKVQGARVLDLFAGSGALGFEAVSRGADKAVLVEKLSARAKHLRVQADILTSSEIEVLTMDTRYLIANTLSQSAIDGPCFDLIFLDPPFADTDLRELCAKLESGGWIADDALIYLELARDAIFPELPEQWRLEKRQTAAKVCYALARR